MLEFVLHISLLIEGIVSRRWRGIWRRTMQTIIHYCRSFYGYLKSDAILRERYKAVSAIYNEEFDSVYIMDKERLKKEGIYFEARNF